MKFINVLIIIGSIFINSFVFANSIYDKQFQEFKDLLNKYETVNVITYPNKGCTCYILNLKDTDESEFEAILLNYIDKFILIEKLSDNKEKKTILYKPEFTKKA